MSNNLETAVRQVPKPPEPPKSKEFRSFAKLMVQRVYLLDGFEYNPNPNDTREKFDTQVQSHLDSGCTKGEALEKAYQDRFEEFGYGKEHGFYEQPVMPWFPGNFCVLLRPIMHEHTLKYYANHNETIDSLLLKIIAVTQNYAQIVRGDKDEEGKPIQPFREDGMGMIEVPFLGPMYGPLDINKAELAAFVLSCHGRVVGKTPAGEYVTEEVTEEEVYRRMPHGFINFTIDPETGMTVFDEILSVSTLFNLDLIEKEMTEDKVIKDDEAKNSNRSSRQSETSSYGKKRSKTATAKQG